MIRCHHYWWLASGILASVMIASGKRMAKVHLPSVSAAAAARRSIGIGQIGSHFLYIMLPIVSWLHMPQQLFSLDWGDAVCLSACLLA